jgi:hypothetical protein
MCFTHDYDWRAEVEEDTVTKADRPTICDECRKIIHIGSWLRHVRQQEYEQCQRCEDGDSCDYEENHPECAGGDHEHGETFDWDCCEACDKVLRAIKAAELEDGCREWESQPALTQLPEAMFYDRRDGGRYLAKVREMFPEVEAHARSLAGED